MANVKMVSNTMPVDYALEQQQLDRARAYAQALQQQSAQPLQQQNTGRFHMAPSVGEGLMKAFGSVLSAKMASDTDRQQTDLTQRYGTDRNALLAKALQAHEGTPDQPGAPLPDGVEGPVQPTPGVPGSTRKMAEILIGGQFPDLQQVGMSQLMKEQDKPVVVGRSLLNPQTGAVVGTDATWKDEQTAAMQQRKQDQEAARQQHMEELKMRIADQGTAREDRASLQRQLADMNISARRDIAEMNNAQRQQKNTPKLPTSALKMQQEELDAIGSNSSINADLGALEKQIDDGKLNLSPTSNLISKARNTVGISNEESRNYASFTATLEKLRNDSLRLNKGVQTEGDAQRAWNELIANANDKAVVKQRLREIQKINERAVGLRKMNIDSIRSNFGVDPMDVSGYQNQAPAVGGSGGGWKIERVP